MSVAICVFPFAFIYVQIGILPIGILPINVILSPLIVVFSSLSIFDNKRQDPTGLTALLQSTDLVGVLHMLYCILLHSAPPEPLSVGPTGPQGPYSSVVIQVALQGLRFLNTFALLDLSAFQVFISDVALVCN